MILIINICKEKLHYYEFVKPVEGILKKEKIGFFLKSYKKISQKDLKKADKIIICGTSLFDNEFVDNLDKFDWIRGFDKPILGICGGMQIIGLIFNENLKADSEIGFFYEDFKKEFLGLKGKQEVYHLHNNYLNFSKSNLFEVFANKKKITQAIKHNSREIYGVLFHPEVRQKDLIRKFCLL